MGWRGRDWVLVGAAAVLGLIIARAVMKRDDR
jgi:hypothetical protein